MKVEKKKKEYSSPLETLVIVPSRLPSLIRRRWSPPLVLPSCSSATSRVVQATRLRVVIETISFRLCMTVANRRMPQPDDLRSPFRRAAKIVATRRAFRPSRRQNRQMSCASLQTEPKPAPSPKPVPAAPTRAVFKALAEPPLFC